jgi:hypothetical protein
MMARTSPIAVFYSKFSRTSLSSRAFSRVSRATSASRAVTAPRQDSALGTLRPSGFNASRLFGGPYSQGYYGQPRVFYQPRGY